MMFVVGILGLAAWLCVGCVVLAAVDTDRQFYRWARSAPHVAFYRAIVWFWPLALVLYYARKK